MDFFKRQSGVQAAWPMIFNPYNAPARLILRLKDKCLKRTYYAHKAHLKRTYSALEAHRNAMALP